MNNYQEEFDQFNQFNQSLNQREQLDQLDEFDQSSKVINQPLDQLDQLDQLGQQRIAFSRTSAPSSFPNSANSTNISNPASPNRSTRSTRSTKPTRSPVTSQPSRSPKSLKSSKSPKSPKSSRPSGARETERTIDQRGGSSINNQANNRSKKRSNGVKGRSGWLFWFGRSMVQKSPQPLGNGKKSPSETPASNQVRPPVNKQVNSPQNSTSNFPKSQTKPQTKSHTKSQLQSQSKGVMSAASQDQPVKTAPKGRMNGGINGGINGKNPRYGSSSVPRKAQKESTVLYGLRLLILGVGLGSIVGTVLYVSDPATRLGAELPKAANAASSSPATPPNSMSDLKLSKEIPQLKGKLTELAAARPEFQVGVFLQEVDSRGFVSLLGDNSFAAASTIKLPILMAFFQDVDAGKIKLQETLTLEEKAIGGGAGELQDQPIGTKYTALDVATRMMVGSDNTATNMVIDRLGGIAILNQRFQSWGLKETKLQASLPDLGGTNITTPKELTRVLASLEQGELLSRKSRDFILSIMQRTENDSLLPQGLGKNAAIAHKTGTLGELVADAGLVYMPNGKRYILVVIVKQPRNDQRGSELVRQISRTVYDYFRQF